MSAQVLIEFMAFMMNAKEDTLQRYGKLLQNVLIACL